MFTPDESSPSDSESSSEPFVAETWSIVIFSLANGHQVSKSTLQCVCGDEKRMSQSTRGESKGKYELAGERIRP
jgi:hypothetical protein